jgi:hypothetical protein
MIQNFKENLNINFISQSDLWFSGKTLKSIKITSINNLPTHQHDSQSLGIIPILEYLIQFFKENPNIHFISQLDPWFSGKLLYDTKITSDDGTLIMDKKYMSVYFYISNLYILELQGEFEYPLCFSIGLMILR